MTSMSSYEARRATFYPPEETGKTRKKAVPAQWPHPTPPTASSTSSAAAKATKSFPHPSEMAHLGLYFDASAISLTEQDVCSLYPEELTLSGWKMGDVVAERIREADPKAALLLIRDSKEAGLEDVSKNSTEWHWTDEELIPNGKAMIAARVKTFASGWPYDGKKGWKPTSKKVAAAGFHFTPNEDEEDCVTCVYCDCSLGGWEKSDDPTKEHQRRRPECAFFNCVLIKPKDSSAKSRAVSISTTTKQQRSRAVSKRKVREEEEAEENVEIDIAPEKETEIVTKGEDEVANADSQAQQKLESAIQSKKRTTDMENEPLKMSATSRKVSKRAPTTPASTTAKVREDAPCEETKENSMPNELQISTPSKMEAHTGQQNTQVPTTPQKAEDAQVNSVQAQQAEIRKSTKPEPFSIAPMTTMNKLSAAEEQMTVEAWLKEQVTGACEEMEREGIARIERLREEIAKGRTEVESFLRGTNKASIHSVA